MGLSYVSSEDRTRLSRPGRRPNLGAGLLFIATTLVGLFAIGLACEGRLTRASIGDARTTVNLNTVSDASQLESVLETRVVERDRRPAAQRLYAFLSAARGDRTSLSNVGAILRASRSASGGPPLLTPEDLAALKPALVVRTLDEFRRSVLLHGFEFVAAFYVVALVWLVLEKRADLLLLSAIAMLSSLGFALLVSRPDPLRDTLLFERYTQGVVVGCALIVLLSVARRGNARFPQLSYLPLIGALALSALLILLGGGPGASGTKVNLGPIQPIEAIRLLLALFLAGYFARRWELIRQVQTRAVGRYRLPRWLNMPSAEYVAPLVAGVVTSLAFFFIQKDLGPALLLSCVFLATYAVARGRVGMVLAGTAVLAAGFYVGYRLNISTTLAARVGMWESPWDNVVRGGDQVAQAIWALSSGGVAGAGLGLGDIRYLPAGHTDLVLAGLGEEMGFAGLLAAAGLFGFLGWRGLRIAATATSEYGFFLATTLTLFLVTPMLVMTAGLLGVTPLTGVVTPFLSYGGSAMAANFFAVGLLNLIEVSPKPSATVEPFARSNLWLHRVLAGCAMALLGVALNCQVLRADGYATKGHLTLQADGVRRYQYNQRLIDVARTIPRGTIFDRDGLVLATSEPDLVQRARDSYGKLGVRVSSTCATPVERCYPLGGMTFHLLGDAVTRTNWAASNTSYIERDREDRLRGFADRPTLVDAIDGSRRGTVTIERDYRTLLPLLRHRYDPDHAAVKAFLSAPRDERLTVSAKLQLRVAATVAKFANRSQTGHAAAVVLDPATGELLATVSYPWPSIGAGESDQADDRDGLLDRARYGLYPPGSTFKLVTAAAALESNRQLSRTPFTCERLADGRVGARIKGWSRPVRDDVMDTHPHGTITMRDAITQSCNAFFGQLAVDIGPKALSDMAERLGIAVVPASHPGRLRDTLPQAGYGQGDVVATPLKMARVAGLFAEAGTFPAPRWVFPAAAGREPSTAQVLAPESAELVGEYMREVVLTGTGRVLRNNPGRIAGKTGTAEVAGAPSHSWFVGFAPYGLAPARIAFAVIVENAGYGSLAAAPIAGEIVDAAVSLGMIR